jgi:nucleoside-diphosphate-sugar epimerase
MDMETCRMARLVSGAAGLVGLNALDILLTAGETVVGFDALPLPPRAARDFAARPGRLVAPQGDVLSAAGLDAAFAAVPIGAVLRAAGAARDRADPGRIVAVNLGGAIAMLKAAARHGATRFVYSGLRSSLNANPL